MICTMLVKDGVVESLKILGSVGLDGITVTAPNATQALLTLLKDNKNQDYPVHKIIKELKRHDLIYANKSGSDYSLHLTPAGAYRLQEIFINEIYIPITKKWDKKWRVVTFDVPIAQSRSRQLFTKKLKALGFEMVQKSLWAHPSPCFKQLNQLASHYNILRYCSFFEISKLDELSEKNLIKKFSYIISK